MSDESLSYLGIDLGTTALRAVLLKMNPSTRDRNPQDYPLYWQKSSATDDEERFWELPAVAYLEVVAPSSSTLSPLVGWEASARAQRREGVFLESLKSDLNVGIPYYARDLNRWEPKLQASRHWELSLDWVQRAVRMLLASLDPVGEGDYRVGAVGLSQSDLSAALKRLSGAILSCPTSWSDAYRFNLREAVLAAGLVESSGQIFFVEEAIAALLGASRWQDEPYSGHYALPSGATLVLHGGATTTELALGILPESSEALSEGDWARRGLPYGGRAIAEDLFYQLLYPQWLPEQPFLAKLNLEVPQPGQPDRLKRDRARVQLLEFPGGRRWLETAERAWQILQRQDEFNARLGEQEWGVQRRAFQGAIVDPWLEQLNGELNALLGETGLIPEQIVRVFCSGGSVLALFDDLQAWLGSKLPNATLVREPECEETSWVASGLARLPFFPQACDRIRHQYGEYFLLRELLQVLPNRSFSLEELMAELERRGINPRACTQLVQRLLEGYLPPGLVPTTDNARWLALTSQQNRDYLGLTTAPLFARVGSDRYRANGKQCQRLRQYFSALLSGRKQTLEEPLFFSFSD
ncbi:MAG: hypothetical protein SVX43_03780 [Cyanobacteriota bacterium]|nr:hypothetical protein [Cyanobacteriota bacterium]